MANKFKVSPPIATVVNGHTFTVDKRYVLQDSKILGKGSFGVVCTAYDSVRKIDLAIKRIRPYANDEWDARHCLREIRLLKLLGPHPNIISLFELSLFEEKTELYMAMELMDCDLHRVIQSKQPLSEKHHKCFVKQMLEGIKAMHAIGVFHRDLKPGNILVSKDCQLRITDFGLARFMDESTRKGANQENPMTEYVVTRWYRCPEILLSPNKPYSEAIDLWSIGCILAELIKRKPLFPGKSHANQVQLIFEVMGYNNVGELGFPVSAEASSFLDKRCRYRKQPLQKILPGVSVDAVELLEALLSVGPKMRPSAEAALFFPFLMEDCEVLHDYTKTYLTRPSKEFFDFETEKQTVPYLKDMIESEVIASLASKYQHNEPPAPYVPMHASDNPYTTTQRTSKTTARTATTSTSTNMGQHEYEGYSGDMGGATEAKITADNVPVTARMRQQGNADYRRLSNADSMLASHPNVSQDDHEQSGGHTDGPASQLQTQRNDRQRSLLPEQGIAGGKQTTTKRDNNPFRKVDDGSDKNKGVVRVASSRDHQSPNDIGSCDSQNRQGEVMVSVEDAHTVAHTDAHTVGSAGTLSVSDADALPLPMSTSTTTNTTSIPSHTYMAHTDGSAPMQYDAVVRPTSNTTNGPGFTDNILMAVREEAAIATGKKSPRSSSGLSKSPRPSPKKMEQILQKDLNNKKRFLQQGLLKQQTSHNTSSEPGSKVHPPRGSTQQTSQNNIQPVRAGTRPAFQYNQNAVGKPAVVTSYQTTSARRANSSSRGMAQALGGEDESSSIAEKPRAVSASLITQLQNTYQNISGKMNSNKGSSKDAHTAGGNQGLGAPGQAHAAGGGTAMHLRSGSSLMNSGSNVILRSSKRQAQDEFQS